MQQKIRGLVIVVLPLNSLSYFYQEKYFIFDVSNKYLFCDLFYNFFLLFDM